MNELRTRASARRTGLVFLAGLLALFVQWPEAFGLGRAVAAAPAPASVEVVASRLTKPRGLAFGPEGSLYVAEGGTGGPQLIDLGRIRPHTIGRTGRISRIGLDGARSTVVDGLPSTVTAYNEPVGPSGLAFLDGQLYLLTAAGGWEIGDPDFHNGVFRVQPDGSIERVFDYSAYTLEHPTRSRLEDPRADVPLGMPYGLVALDGRLYSTDGNQEQILAIGPEGEATRIFEYPRSDRALTGITAGPDGALYVAEFAANTITRVTPDGQATDVVTGLERPIAVAFDQAGQLYALEYHTGHVVRVAPAGQEQQVVLSEELQDSTAMALGPDGSLYLSTGGGKANLVGRIVRARLSPPPAAAEALPKPLVPLLVGFVSFVVVVEAAIRLRRARS